ncbi:MAG: DNA-processing protein DprA [Pseudomonadota bacterium]
MAENASSSLTPLTPPLTEEDRLSWLRLIRCRRVGVSTFFRLMHEHGNADAALGALPDVARAAGVENYETFSRSAAEDEYRRAQMAGARLICFGDADYPGHLSEIPDAPPLLWALGRLETLKRAPVAIVGARNASSLGLRMARRLADGLADAGFTVVSGLARGIDAAAHQAALAEDRTDSTVAVLAGGVDVVYPAENVALAQDIAERGLRLSEAPVGLPPKARHFPPRNRIVSGMSKAVVVVEAAAKSGSLITARLAADQGRDVMAVPGHPFDGRATGCNHLIRDGATLVGRVEDIVEALGADRPAATKAKAVSAPPLEHSKDRRTPAQTQALHQEILDRIGPSPVAEDLVLRDLGGAAPDLLAEILELEAQGRIRRAPGGLLTRSGESVH